MSRPTLHLTTLPTLLILLLGWAAASADAMPQRLTWTWFNPTEQDFSGEPMPLAIDLPNPFRPAEWVVKQDGVEVPWQVEVFEGDQHEVQQGRIWVLASARRHSSISFSLEQGQARNENTNLRITRDGGTRYELENQHMAIRIPASQTMGLPGPIEGIRQRDGGWMGVSRWETTHLLDALQVELSEPGPVFARATLRYRFLSRDPEADPEQAPQATVEVTLWAGKPFAEIRETLRMGPEDAWHLNLTTGWSPTHMVFRPFGSTEADSAELRTELTGQPPAPELVDQPRFFLMPRWSRGPNRGWAYAQTDRRQMLAAVAVRAGLWHAPFEGILPHLVQDQFGHRTLRFPTPAGSRFWLLTAMNDPGEPVRLDGIQPLPGRPGVRPPFQPGVRPPMGGARPLPGLTTGTAAGVGDRLRFMVVQDQLASPAKLAADFLTEFVGRREGAWAAEWVFGHEAGDPMGAARQTSATMLRRAQEMSLPRGSAEILSNMQVRLDPDHFPHYANGWSPPTAGEGTLQTRTAVIQALSLRDHPRFDELRRMAVNALEVDMAFSVALPGGAGQDAPGLMTEAMQTWYQLAEPVNAVLGTDLRQSPRYAAAAGFLLRTSVPDQAGRRVLPMGDVDPTVGLSGTELIRLIRDLGNNERVNRLTTDELPGFGVVFRNDPGGERETVLAFKAGPNRSGFQGDQLAIHYVGHRERRAVAHMTTPENRAPQEHMHNRVAFSTPEMPYADIGGYERLIAYNRTRWADVAIGRVESSRMHEVPRLPPAPRFHSGPYHQLLQPIVYQRTIVFVRTEDRNARDYVVIRDEFEGPAVNATYCLHVESDAMELRNRVFVFGDRLSVGVAAPQNYTPDELNWTNPRGPHGPEATRGLRLTLPPSDEVTTRGQFITVLYPDGQGMDITPGQNSVTITLPGNRRDVITFSRSALEENLPPNAPLVQVNLAGRNMILLRARDIDLNRSQGEIGLFRHEPGADFGPVPQWLLDQRANFPEPGRRNLLHPSGR